MKYSKIKLVALLAMMFFTSSKIFAQNQIVSKTIPNSFIIHGNLEADKLSLYTTCIEAADFEQYRLKDAPLELNFKNGFKLELISAKDLTIKNKMQNVNPNSYKEKSSVPVNYIYPVFEIMESGWITAQMTAVDTKIKK